MGWISSPYDMQSFIVWTMVRIAPGETAGKEMRRWSEPRRRVIVVDLAKPSETRGRRSSVC